MKADIINVDKFVFESILDCRGRRAFNEHGYMVIRGIIKQEMEAKYLSLIQTQERVRITVSNLEGEEVNLFHGIIYEAQINHENGVPVLQIHLKTGSYLTDIKKHMRSFQQEGLDYRWIAENCLKEYPGANFILGKISPDHTQNFLMQYEETDWEFLIRLVSGSGTVLLADDETGYAKLYLGLPNFNKVYNINNDCFTVRKTHISMQEESFPIYEVKSRELYKVGEHIRFLEKMFLICAVDTYMEGNELVHIYYLTSEAGMARSRIYNKELAGNAVTAKVAEVKEAYVSIDIEMDEAINKNKKMFPYATLYSTPDGTGWYCMPEVGDQVRLYFPTDNEEDAYVESSVHLQTDNPSRKNPQEKSFMNRQKKEILFTPDSLILRNNAGLSVELLDKQGIRIISDKSIFVRADNLIQISSNAGEIEMSAADSIEMTQGNAQFKIADKITMTGGKINLN